MGHTGLSLAYSAMWARAGWRAGNSINCRWKRKQASQLDESDRRFRRNVGGSERTGDPTIVESPKFSGSPVGRRLISSPGQTWIPVQRVRVGVACAPEAVVSLCRLNWRSFRPGARGCKLAIAMGSVRTFACFRAVSLYQFTCGGELCRIRPRAETNNGEPFKLFQLFLCLSFIVQ